MIANQREYRITAAAIRRLEEGLQRADEHGAERPPLAQQLLREGIEGQLETLREQVAEYEALQSGTVAVLEADSLTQLPDALIRARIASGLTQRALAERLGLKEQQLQRYEATRYAGVSLGRAEAIADALGVTIHERIVLPAAVGEARRSPGAPTPPPAAPERSAVRRPRAR
jgi:DNA-binding XRE family transcriptional regulator